MGHDPLHEGRNYSDVRASHVDRAIAALADRQHGTVSSRQLLALGLDKHAIHYRVGIGRLHRIHRGVFAVGHKILTREGYSMAAVLAYGQDAVLSHRSAAKLWGFWSSFWKIELTTPKHQRRRPGIRPYVAQLHPEDVFERMNIPVTSPARTILDLATLLRPDPLERAIEEADRAELLDASALQNAIDRNPRRDGTPKLRAVLADYRGPRDTRSKHERVFRKLIAKAGLPEPQFNVLVAGILVDAHWPQWKLVVEIDSRAFHTGPRAFERDRIRDAELQKAGYRVLRVTEKRLYGDPQGIIADIRALAGRAAG